MYYTITRFDVKIYQKVNFMGIYWYKNIISIHFYIGSEFTHYGQKLGISSKLKSKVEIKCCNREVTNILQMIMISLSYNTTNVNLKPPLKVKGK